MRHRVQVREPEVARKMVRHDEATPTDQSLGLSLGQSDAVREGPTAKLGGIGFKKNDLLGS